MLILLADVTKQATRILYSTDFIAYNDAEQQLLWECFISKLECMLEVAREEINFAQLWADKTPSAANHRPLEAFLQKVCAIPSLSIAEIETDMSLEYILANVLRVLQQQKQLPTRLPQEVWKGAVCQPICEVAMVSIRSRNRSHQILCAIVLTSYRDRGAQVSKADNDRGLEEIRIFRKWFADQVLGSTKSKQNTLILMPLEVPVPLFRDAPNPWVLTCFYYDASVSHK